VWIIFLVFLLSSFMWYTCFILYGFVSSGWLIYAIDYEMLLLSARSSFFSDESLKKSCVIRSFLVTSIGLCTMVSTCS
jgi:hypothetical protein